MRSGIPWYGAGVTANGFGGQRKQPRIAQRGAAGSPVGVHRDAGHLGVVQPGAAQLRIGKIETQRLDQVQAATRIRAKADRISCIGRNLGSDQDYVEHDCRCLEWRRFFLK